MKKLLLLTAILVFGNFVASASPLCLPATLAVYVANEGTNGPCHVNAGAVDLLFTFGASPFSYSTDSSLTFTESDVFVTPVSGPGNLAGFTFALTNFAIPDGNFADINLQYQVSIDPGSLPTTLRLNSAHLDVVGSGGGDAGVSEADFGPSASFLLQWNNPDHVGDLLNANYAPVFMVIPNTDSFVTPRSQISSITETFDLTTNVPEPGTVTAMAGGLLLMLWGARKRVVRGFGLLAMLAIVSAAVSHAAPLCTNISVSGISLAALEAQGACSYGDVIFGFDAGSFQVISSTGSTNLPTASSTTVKFVQQPGGGGQSTFGFLFTFFENAATGAGNSATIAYSFTVQAPSTKLLSFSTFGNGTGTANNLAQLTRPDTSLIGSVTNPTSGVLNPNPNLPLSEPLNELIKVTNTMSVTNNSHFSGLQDTFTAPAPEPMTNLYVGSGLLAAFFLSRKMRRAA